MIRYLRLSVLFALVLAGCGGNRLETVPGAIDVLQSSIDPKERYKATQVLGSFRAEAGWAAIDPLIAALADDDPGVRVGAAYALAAIGLESGNARRALIQALSSSEAELRVAAAYAIPAVSWGDKSALPALEAALQDQEPRVQQEAKTAIRKIELAVRFRKN